jgi:hypothetical protein
MSRANRAASVSTRGGWSGMTPAITAPRRLRSAAAASIDSDASSVMRRPSS